MQICQKWFRLDSLELFAPNVKSLKRTKDSVTLSEEAQLHESIWTEWLTSGSKSFAYSKMSKKTENLSKMVLGGLFATFWSQYRIVPINDIYF